MDELATEGPDANMVLLAEDTELLDDIEPSSVIANVASDPLRTPNIGPRCDAVQTPAMSKDESDLLRFEGKFQSPLVDIRERWSHWKWLNDSTPSAAEGLDAVWSTWNSMNWMVKISFLFPLLHLSKCRGDADFGYRLSETFP